MLLFLAQIDLVILVIILSLQHTSMIIYWLWITNFYFKSGLKNFLNGSLVFIMILTIFMDKSYTKICFLILVYLIWTILIYIIL